MRRVTRVTITEVRRTVTRSASSGSEGPVIDVRGEASVPSPFERLRFRVLRLFGRKASGARTGEEGSELERR